MSEVIEIVKTSFDYLENRIENAIQHESLGMFGPTHVLTAQGSASKFISDLPEVKIYIGWGGEIYPQFKLVKHTVNS